MEVASRLDNALFYPIMSLFLFKWLIILLLFIFRTLPTLEGVKTSMYSLILLSKV
jgi:hypothetical protein